MINMTEDSSYKRKYKQDNINIYTSASLYSLRQTLLCNDQIRA
jgi:hypothetical protein